MPRPEIHPEYHPVIFKDDEYELVTRSTMTSKETREVDGVEHYVIRLDISSASHPFWTGQQRFVDTEGRVERFRAKYGLSKKKDDKKEAKAEEAPAEEAKAEEAPAEEAKAEEAPAEEAKAEEAPAETKEAPAGESSDDAEG